MHTQISIKFINNLSIKPHTTRCRQRISSLNCKIIEFRSNRTHINESYLSTPPVRNELAQLLHSHDMHQYDQLHLVGTE